MDQKIIDLLRRVKELEGELQAMSSLPIETPTSQYKTHPNKTRKTDEELIQRLNEIDNVILEKTTIYMEKKLIWEGQKKPKDSPEYLEAKQTRENLRDLWVEKNLLLWILGV